jgi:16S rRNA (guanine966-N2)-methyltransferase
MRVIAGKFKGTRLFSPKNNLVRPTSDRVREFVFSCLFDVNNAIVLDLFAGTGAFGIEAMSRGAREAVFVDSAGASIELLNKNLEKVKLKAPVYRTRAEQFLKSALMDEKKFDIIFCDPPYAYKDINKIAEAVLSNQLIETENGILIYESSAKTASPELYGFELFKEKTMGDTRINLYKTNG